MSLAVDANHKVIMSSEGDPIGGYFQLSTAQKSTTAWNRLMPHGNAASVVSDNDRQLNIGTLRTDVLSVRNWNLMILNEGYFEQHRIKEYNNSILTLDKPLNNFGGLKTLDSAIEFVIYPSLVVPMGILYLPSVTADFLEIGVAEENVYSPTPKKYVELKADQQLSMPTLQIQKIFYKFTNLTNSATHAMSWGEHHIYS